MSLSVIHYHHATLLPWQWWLTMGLIVVFGVLVACLWAATDDPECRGFFDLLEDIERNTRR